MSVSRTTKKSKRKGKSKINPQIVAVDLFCGAGGLTHGLLDAGVEVRMGVDFDSNCRYAYETNNKGATFLNKSVTDVKKKDFISVYGETEGVVKLLAGCAPCQTFSRYNQKATDADDRWWLLAQFGRLVEESKPDLVAMENVQDLEEKNVFEQFVAGLKKQKYHVFHKVVNCLDYGIPQKRQRLVLLASKLGPIKLTEPSGEKAPTVREMIADLPKLTDGQTCPTDSLHHCARLSKMNKKRIRASKAGGTWRDWPDELKLPCHQRDTGKTYGGVYGRMKWDDIAPTMTTQFFGYGNGRFGHPEQHRAISLREGAIFQTFPRDYQFIDPSVNFSISVIGKMIGNAVPVKLGKVIGESLIAHLKDVEAKKNSKEGKNRK